MPVSVLINMRGWKGYCAMVFICFSFSTRQLFYEGIYYDKPNEKQVGLSYRREQISKSICDEVSLTQKREDLLINWNCQFIKRSSLLLFVSLWRIRLLFDELSGIVIETEEISAVGKMCQVNVLTKRLYRETIDFYPIHIV